jgi:hypothetical protein
MPYMLPAPGRVAKAVPSQPVGGVAGSARVHGGEAAAIYILDFPKCSLTGWPAFQVIWTAERPPN